jgi:hypothetical protein
LGGGFTQSRRQFWVISKPQIVVNLETPNRRQFLFILKLQIVVNLETPNRRQFWFISKPQIVVNLKTPNRHHFLFISNTQIVVNYKTSKWCQFCYIKNRGGPNGGGERLFTQSRCQFCVISKPHIAIFTPPTPHQFQTTTSFSNSKTDRRQCKKTITCSQIENLQIVVKFSTPKLVVRFAAKCCAFPVSFGEHSKNAERSYAYMQWRHQQSERQRTSILRTAMAFDKHAKTKFAEEPSLHNLVSRNMNLHYSGPQSGFQN